MRYGYKFERFNIYTIYIYTKFTDFILFLPKLIIYMKLIYLFSLYSFNYNYLLFFVYYLNVNKRLLNILFRLFIDRNNGFQIFYCF